MAGEDEKKESVSVTTTTTSTAAKEDEKKKDKESPAEELSEEDQALKEGLELAVVRLQDEDESLHRPALDHLANEIRSSTSSMTSVPKPLKFLRPHYATLKDVYAAWPVSHEMKKHLADVLSVLAMTMGAPGERESLRYKLAGHRTHLSQWGHEYVRALSGEVAQEFATREEQATDESELFVDDLLVLIDDMVPFQMKHNAETDACDLLLEVRQLPKLLSIIEGDATLTHNVDRVCLYLLRCASFISEPEDLEVLLQTTHALYLSQAKYCDALRVAIMMGDDEKITWMLSDECGASALEKKQMAFVLARHKHHCVSADEELNTLIGNTQLSEQFVGVAKALDMLTVKTPEDIYKTEKKSRNGGLSAPTQTAVDSLRANLAATYVNAFTHAGLGIDALMTASDSDWVFKNKNCGALAAAASLGLVMMWNVDEGINALDKFFHTADPFLTAGAHLGVGLAASGVRHESDPALALLSECLTGEETTEQARTTRIASLLGLSVAYAGQQREEVREICEAVVLNESATLKEVSLAALCLGVVYAGSANEDVASTLLQKLMESTETDLDQSVSRFLALGLALLFLGKSEKADAALQALQTITHPRARYAEITLTSCAYAGTGNVLKVQEMLSVCAAHIADEKEAEHQMCAVLGLSLIALGEDVGTDMTLRAFEHLLHYGELPLRRTVPLALALLYVSNPDYGVVDIFSRLSHDVDERVAMNAILGLGLVSAGTNNSRVVGVLRTLADFYAKSADHLYCVRISLGLASLGKGLLTLSPLHSDRQLLSFPVLAGLLIFLHSGMDLSRTLLDEQLHFLLFFLSISMSPRYLLCLEEGEGEGGLQNVHTAVRVGQAVETVGQAGRPKTITGFQTHTTPVLLGFKERAELAGSEYKAVCSVVEGVVLVKKVPQSAEATNAPTA